MQYPKTVYLAVNSEAHRRKPLGRRPDLRTSWSASSDSFSAHTEASLQRDRTLRTPPTNANPSQTLSFDCKACFLYLALTSRADLPYPEHASKPYFSNLLPKVNVSLQCFRTLTSLEANGEGVGENESNVDPMVEHTRRWRGYIACWLIVSRCTR